MEIQDLIFGPFYVLLFLGLAAIYKKKLLDKDLQKYFMRGLQLKFAGSLFVAFVYLYYYGTGDTIFYFRRAVLLTDIIKNDFGVGLKVLFSNPSVYDFETNDIFLRLKARDTSTFLLVKIASIFNLFCFNSFLSVAIFFSFFSYIGIWKGFETFLNIFPDYKKEVAISFLFIPSVFFWGSGLFKDCLTFGFLGLLIHSFYFIFIKAKNIPVNTVFMIISIYIIGMVKGYILMALLPAVVLWIFMIYRNKIKSQIIRTLATPFFLALTVLAGAFILTSLASTFKKFSIENVQDRAEDMQRWHTYRVETIKKGEGSSYNLGSVEFTAAGVAKKIPAAINVALFRPYIWEVSNPLALISAFESLVLLYLTLLFLRSLYKNFRETIGFLQDNPSLIFMLVFSLIFAFSVGFTSYNFGALSRYRIPVLPFYSSFILILYSFGKKLNENNLKSKKL